MANTREIPTEPALDFDPQVRDKIALLLEKLRTTQDPAAQEQICDALDKLIFHDD